MNSKLLNKYANLTKQETTTKTYFNADMQEVTLDDIQSILDKSLVLSQTSTVKQTGSISTEIETYLLVELFSDDVPAFSRLTVTYFAEDTQGIIEVIPEGSIGNFLGHYYDKLDSVKNLVDTMPVQIKEQINYLTITKAEYPQAISFKDSTVIVIPCLHSIWVNNNCEAKTIFDNANNTYEYFKFTGDTDLLSFYKMDNIRKEVTARPKHKNQINTRTFSAW